MLLTLLCKMNEPTRIKQVIMGIVVLIAISTVINIVLVGGWEVHFEIVNNTWHISNKDYEAKRATATAA